MRANIDEEMYQNFFDYCLEVCGDVDINSWTMAQVREVKFVAIHRSPISLISRCRPRRRKRTMGRSIPIMITNPNQEIKYTCIICRKMKVRKSHLKYRSVKAVES